jgi:hypothetical protein
MFSRWVTTYSVILPGEGTRGARTAERVVEFHDDLSPRESVDLRRENRALWERWLSPEGFFASFHKHFPE